MGPTLHRTVVVVSATLLRASAVALAPVSSIVQNVDLHQGRLRSTRTVRVAGPACDVEHCLWGRAGFSEREVPMAALHGDVLPGRAPSPGGERRGERTSVQGASRAQQCAAGALAFLLLMTCWGAWVLLIGSRSCALSYLWWR
jgi:hypothetical protein